MADDCKHDAKIYANGLNYSQWQKEMQIIQTMKLSSRKTHLRNADYTLPEYEIK